MRRRHDYDPDSDCAGWEGCAYWKRQYPGAWWNVTNDPIDAEGVGRGEASPLWSFVHSRALNRLALRTKLRILHATGAPATTDGGALVYLKHDAMGPYGEACLLVFNPGAAQAITVDLSPLPSALLAGSTVPTDLLDRSGAERFRGTAAAAAAGGLPSMPPPLAAAWTVPMGAGEVKAFGGFRLGTFAPRAGKRGPCAADDGYALRSNRTTLQGCFLQCLGDARCAHVHVAYVRIVWMESPPPVSCTLLGPMRDARAACSAGTGTLVSKLVGGRPFADVEAERAALSEYRARVLAHGTYDAHALAPEVRTLTSLPTLNATNAAEHPQWHAYVRRLYGPAAAGMLPLDLNTFTWFYWFAPLRLRHILLCDWIDSYAEAPHGTPWTGGLAAWSWGPEHLVRRAGFFVHRRRWADDAYEAAPRLEVMRIGPIPRAGFDEGAQAVWMYHAIGSGVLVRRDSFARLEVRHVRQAAVRPRLELVPTTPCTHPPLLPSPAGALRAPHGRAAHRARRPPAPHPRPRRRHPTLHPRPGRPGWARGRLLAGRGALRGAERRAVRLDVRAEAAALVRQPPGAPLARRRRPNARVRMRRPRRDRRVHLLRVQLPRQAARARAAAAATAPNAATSAANLTTSDDTTTAAGRHHCTRRAHTIGAADRPWRRGIAGQKKAGKGCFGRLGGDGFADGDGGAIATDG